MSNNIEEKLLKIKQLAEKAVGGEKTVAEQMLNKLLEKNNLTLDMILQENEKDIKYFDFHYKATYEKILLIQIISKVLNSVSFKQYRTKNKRQMLGIYCTPAQAVEIELEYEFHCRMLEQELNNYFVFAYIDANDIYSQQQPENIDVDDFSAEKLDKLNRITSMSKYVDKHTRQLMLNDKN